MTLVEVMIASAVLAIVTGAVITTVVTSSRLNYSSAQHMAAFGLCEQRLELMRSVHFDQIVPTNFPAETISLTHLGGITRHPLPCTRSSVLTDGVDPVRKDVSIIVAWRFGDRDLEERVDTVIYQND